MDEHTPEIQAIVQSAVAELMRQQLATKEPAAHAQLAEERSKREALEKRVNELVTENKSARADAAEAQRSTEIRAHLQKLGVRKVDLAYKAVQVDITRGEDGKLTAGDQTAAEFLTKFVAENPEFLPPKTGAGSTAAKAGGPIPRFDLANISPAMTRADQEAARQEIMRVITEENA